jgi:hypothetical protein
VGLLLLSQSWIGCGETERMPDGPLSGLDQSAAAFSDAANGASAQGQDAKRRLTDGGAPVPLDGRPSWAPDAKAMPPRPLPPPPKPPVPPPAKPGETAKDGGTVKPAHDALPSPPAPPPKPKCPWTSQVAGKYQGTLEGVISSSSGPQQISGTVKFTLIPKGDTTNLAMSDGEILGTFMDQPFSKPLYGTVKCGEMFGYISDRIGNVPISGQYWGNWSNYRFPNGTWWFKDLFGNITGKGTWQAQK